MRSPRGAPGLAVLLSLAALATVACASSPTIGEGIERPPTDGTVDTEMENIANDDPTPDLTVRVVGLRNDRGIVSVAVYDDPEAYPMERDKVVEAMKTDIAAGAREVELVFTELPPGKYAIAILHDENESGDMDSNALGMPQEGYGASRNPGARLGPPLWEDTVFTLDAPLEVTIEPIY